MDPFFVRAPSATAVPLLVSIPHTGVEVPPAIASRFASPEVAALPDTDWHLHDLYDFVPSLGATTVYARFSRYVIDLNRSPENKPLYPGRDETGLVPTSTFHSQRIHREDPSTEEIQERLRLYWQPYHDRLAQELAAIKKRFGYALLFDAHSIESQVPRLFQGSLPGLMLGDVDGQSAASSISNAVLEVHARSGISFQKNNPFKGGYITRFFGKPNDDVHALQLEMSQRLYMDEGPPFRYRADLATPLKTTLMATLRAFMESAAKVYA